MLNLAIQRDGERRKEQAQRGQHPIGWLFCDDARTRESRMIVERERRVRGTRRIGPDASTTRDYDDGGSDGARRATGETREAARQRTSGQTRVREERGRSDTPLLC